MRCSHWVKTNRVYFEHIGKVFNEAYVALTNKKKKKKVEC